MAKTHYEVLGVTRSATQAEVRRAWKLLASALHPDRRGGTERANAIFAEVTAAYACLRDPDARRRYHDGLLILGRVCVPCRGHGRTGRQRGFTSKEWAPCLYCAGSGVEFRRGGY